MSKIVLVALFRIILPVFLLFLSIAATCQTNSHITNTDTAQTYKLDQCVAYALTHEPFINMAIVNQAIVKATNSIATAGWLPQVNVVGNYTHYFSLPTSFVHDSTGKLVN